jgi:hypothetical protein
MGEWLASTRAGQKDFAIPGFGLREAVKIHSEAEPGVAAEASGAVWGPAGMEPRHPRIGLSDTCNKKGNIMDLE